jgi:2-oxoisovalerate dehydrogenase E1 component alpha subunit
MTFAEVANQATANALDPARGRQLPLHFGSRQKRIVYVKSTLGTQLPHAAGIGYAVKRLKGEQV